MPLLLLWWRLRRWYAVALSAVEVCLLRERGRSLMLLRVRRGAAARVVSIVLESTLVEDGALDLRWERLRVHQVDGLLGRLRLLLLLQLLHGMI